MAQILEEEDLNFTKVVKMLRECGLASISNRLNELNHMVEADPDEVPIDLKSLVKFSIFMIENRDLPMPYIRLSPFGYIYAEWKIEGRGKMNMAFEPSGLVRFTGTYKPKHQKREESLRGVMHVSALSGVNWFVKEHFNEK